MRNKKLNYNNIKVSKRHIFSVLIICCLLGLYAPLASAETTLAVSRLYADTYGIRNVTGTLSPLIWQGSAHNPALYDANATAEYTAWFDVSETGGHEEHIWIKGFGPSGMETNAVYKNNPVGETTIIATTQMPDMGTLTSNTVGKTNCSITWKFAFIDPDSQYFEESDWNVAGTTVFTCYIVPNPPAQPWYQIGNGNDDIYVELLDKIVAACGGESSISNIRNKIADWMYVYMMYNGATSMSEWPMSNQFHLKQFLEECRSQSGPEDGNDCRDFSNLFFLMQAAVGGTGLIIERRDNDGGFYTHALKAANRQSCATYFIYHQIISTGGLHGSVYDPSLKLDSSMPGDNYFTDPGILPKNLNYTPWYSDRISPSELIVDATYTTVVILND